MITVVAYHLHGWEVRVSIEKGDDLDRTIQWLSDHGYRPQRGFDLTPEGLPICPKHGIPMKRREKQGDTWFSHNVGTEEHPLWCRGYPGDSSPGWEFG